MTTQQPIMVGDRFQTLYARDAGRVIEIIRFVDGDRWYARTEASPLNPEAVGNVSRVSERTLRAKYKRVSR